MSDGLGVTLDLRSYVLGVNPTTVDLLDAVRESYPDESVVSLLRVSRSQGVGLAEDGRWYDHSENDEVAEAVRANRPTVLAEQWLRNR